MKKLYIQNIIFGISDSLVSTVGLLSGIDISGATTRTIVLTGIIYAFVEAFSMAVGSFLSEETSEEFESKSEEVGGKALSAGVVMFCSFVLASFIPIFPYLFFSTVYALILSIVLSLLVLFITGAIIARISGLSMLKHGSKTALLGGAAIIIGVIVGKYVGAASK